MSKNGFMSKMSNKLKKLIKSDDIDESYNGSGFYLSHISVSHFESIKIRGKEIVSLSRKIQYDMKKIQKIAEIMNKNIKEENKIKYLIEADKITNKVNENLENLQKSFNGLDDIREFMGTNRDFTDNCTKLNFTKIFPPGNFQW